MEGAHQLRGTGGGEKGAYSLCRSFGRIGASPGISLPAGGGGASGPVPRHSGGGPSAGAGGRRRRRLCDDLRPQAGPGGAGRCAPGGVPPAQSGPGGSPGEDRPGTAGRLCAGGPGCDLRPQCQGPFGAAGQGAGEGRLGQREYGRADGKSAGYREGLPDRPGHQRDRTGAGGGRWYRHGTGSGPGSIWRAGGI